MTPRQDPYRVLGLVPGASPGEIRAAYRRLAKLNHPDAAGERALPRFLAIQAAYEQLVDGEGRLRAGGPAGRGRSADDEAWRASPNRSRASRDAWRARRASGGGAGAGPSGSSRSGASTGGGQASGPTGGAATDREPGGPRQSAGSGGRRAGPGDPRARRTARPGSTTYDEAALPLDPAWDGGAWYGPTSGTYWTLNPREYADPRKHGPEYQARARRASRAGSAPGAGGTTPPATAQRPPATPPSAVGPTPSGSAANPPSAGADTEPRPNAEAAPANDPLPAGSPPPAPSSDAAPQAQSQDGDIAASRAAGLVRRFGVGFRRIPAGRRRP